MPPKRAAATAGASKRKAAAAAEPSSDDEASAASASASESGRESEASAAPPPKKQKTSAGGAVKKAAAAGKGKGKAKGKGKEEEEEEEGAPQAKGKGKGKENPNASTQPRNKTIAADVAFAEKTDAGAVRIATWNICGLAAAQKKGFKYYVDAEDADILILTETKVNDPPADPALSARYPHRYWSISNKKTYSGTAILSKIEPLSVDYTLPGHPDGDAVKGRIVTLEFESCYLVGTYVVNAGAGLKTLDAKKEWNRHFEAYIRALDEKKPVIWTGDLNVAPTELDLANPKTNWNKTPGYTEAETQSYARILNASGKDAGASKFVDVWRARNPDLRHYTYFSYRFNCREKGLGWRLDMFVVSERLEERVKMCEIRSEVYGASDHCPVVMEVAGPL